MACLRLCRITNESTAENLCNRALSGSKLFDTVGISERIYFEKLIGKKSADHKKACNLQAPNQAQQNVGPDLDPNCLSL